VKGAPLLREFAFQPNPLIIQKGSTVTWNNEDLVTHTVTSGSVFNDPQMGKEFDSGLIGKTFEHIFKKTGEYPYFCQVHPTMQGKVIVK
jgi:plastocyanin